MDHHFFDLGGTLIDSVLRKKQAVGIYAKDKSIPHPELIDKIDIAGTRTRDLLHHLLWGKLTEEELHREYEYFRSIEQDIDPILVPWAQEYLSHLQDLWSKTVLVTNSRIRKSIDDIIWNIPPCLREFFPEENIFCRESEDEPKKPNPFLYKRALNGTRANPKRSYAYEDTKRWLQSAIKAWITNCIGVLSSESHNAERLLRNGAVRVIRDYSEIKKM